MDDDDLLVLAESVAKQRGYADFYHWHEKRRKELGLLQAFTEAAGRVGLHVDDARLEEDGKDPPDAWAVRQGERVAIEFTELVDHTLIDRPRRSGQIQWRWWSHQDVEEKLLSILRRKDHPGFGQSVHYWVVVHCDEPALNAEILGRHLTEIGPVTTRGVERCFVLLSYDPGIKSYPLLEVATQKPL